MIKVTKDKIRIKDSLYGFNQEFNVSFRNFFYNDNSIVFCEKVGLENHKILLYKNGKLIELAQSTYAEILYADKHLNQIVFTIKGDNTSKNLAELYLYEDQKNKLICPNVNESGRTARFFILDDDVVMTYLAKGQNEDSYENCLWILFEANLSGGQRLIESDVKDYTAFLTEDNQIKYIVNKWTNIKVRHYAGYFDEDFDWLVIKKGEKSKKFPIGFMGKYFVSPQGKLILLNSADLIHDDDPNDKHFLKRKKVYSLSLINTDSFEEVFIDKTEDSRKFSFKNWLYLAGEFIDLDHTVQCGITIEAHLVEKYPNYFKNGKKVKKQTEFKLNVFFSRTNKKSHYIAMELAKKADKFVAINSIYPLDDSQNYIASFNNESDYNILAALLGDMMYENSEMKFRVFGVDVFDLMRHCSGEISCGIDSDVKFFEYVRYAVSELKKYYQTDSIILIREYLQKDLIDKYNLEKIFISPDKSPYKSLYKEIEHALLKQARLPAKWKSEQDLYRLISSIFDDAFFQYRGSWITPQSIDIYIPRLKCAFEYQGQQHYSSIEYFGGEESYKKRILLDERKKNLCLENGVTLIEWRFDEPITKLVLSNKLRSHGIKFSLEK